MHLGCDLTKWISTDQTYFIVRQKWFEKEDNEESLELTKLFSCGEKERTDVLCKIYSDRREKNIHNWLLYEINIKYL